MKEGLIILKSDRITPQGEVCVQSSANNSDLNMNVIDSS